MGARVRAYPWTTSSLGSQEDWPPSLKTLVSLMHGSAQPMFIVWGPERVWLHNDAMTPVMGKKHAAALGQHALDVVWSEARDELAPLFASVFAGTPVQMEDITLELDRGDRREVAHFSFSYTPVRDDTGEVAGLFGVCIDTSERVPAAKHANLVRAEQDLRESELRYRTLFNAIDEGFCVIEFFDGPHGPNSDYIHVEANPAYAVHTGIPNVVGQKVREMVGAEADGWIELYAGVLKTGKPIRFERKLEATDRWLNLAAFRVEPASRRQVAVLFQDVTARKRAEAALSHLTATLEERVEERTRQLMVAEEALRQSQKMEAVGQLTGGLAHDFNNLLSTVTGSLELLGKRLAEGKTAGIERYLSSAQEASKRAVALTQRLLAFSRRQTLDPKPLDINKLIGGMETLIRGSAGPEVKVEVVQAGGLWATKVDGPQLENALLNLCINARDAMAPNGGCITIETANKWLDDRAARERDLPPGQYVSLCVTDTGTGMPSDIIERAFDPFFTTKPIGRGTGLGLSMVYGFVRQSGGQVRIYSEVGVGTTMSLYLPRYSGVVEEHGDEAKLETSEIGDGETVLVVDDEPLLRMVMTDALQDSGYRALEAHDGPSALKILESDTRVDLLITDVGLPNGMNGRQVADAARQKRPGLKVLFVTGFAENAVVGHGQLAPGMEIVTKPFVVAAFERKVRDMIDR